MALSGESLAASSKARVRRASLLQNEDYAALMEESSVGGIALRLEKTCYAPLLKRFSPENMRRSELEFVLGVAIIAEGVAFRHYMGLNGQKLLDIWLENFDIELFKSHFRLKMRTGEEADFESERINRERVIEVVSDFHLTLVDQEKLFAAVTPKDILASLRRDSLRAALAETFPRGAGLDGLERGLEFQKTVFSMGMVLDRCYFENLYTTVESFGGEEGRMLRILAGTRIDLVNLYWIYRARRFFGMAPEEALTLITKARYRADFRLLTKAAFASPEAYGAVLANTPYEGVFDVDANIGGKDAGVREVGIEKNVYKVLFGVVNRVFLAGVSGFHNVIAYLMLKEFEIRDLIAVIEAVRYGVDKNDARNFLIRPFEDGPAVRNKREKW